MAVFKFSVEPLKTQRLMEAITHILIELDESPTTEDVIIPDNINTLINTIIQDAVAAKTISKSKIKSNSDITKLVIELLETPGGLSKTQMLTISGQINMSSVTLKVKNQLKKDGIYSLQKRGKGPSTFYYLSKNSL